MGVKYVHILANVRFRVHAHLPIWQRRLRGIGLPPLSLTFFLLSQFNGPVGYRWPLLYHFRKLVVNYRGVLNHILIAALKLLGDIGWRVSRGSEQPSVCIILGVLVLEYFLRVRGNGGGETLLLTVVQNRFNIHCSKTLS